MSVLGNVLVDRYVADGFRIRNTVFSQWLSICLCRSAVARSATKARITKAAKETVNSIHEILNIGMNSCSVCSAVGTGAVAKMQLWITQAVICCENSRKICSRARVKCWPADLRTGVCVICAPGLQFTRWLVLIIDATKPVADVCALRMLHTEGCHYLQLTTANYH